MMSMKNNQPQASSTHPSTLITNNCGKAIQLALHVGLKPQSTGSVQVGIKQNMDYAGLSSSPNPIIQKLQNDIFVDDCVSRENTIELAYQRTDELELVVNKGDSSWKESASQEKIHPSRCQMMVLPYLWEVWNDIAHSQIWTISSIGKDFVLPNFLIADTADVLSTSTKMCCLTSAERFEIKTNFF